MPPLRWAREPQAGGLRTAWRLSSWLLAAALLGLRVLWDRLRGRKELSQVGERLRQGFEELGGTAVKLGQQLALRADLLPFEVAGELMLLTDSVRAFPSSYAIERVEALTGKPLSETFAVFDPVPIGAASIACVYQARLLDGSRVAVKVRRPGVGRDFAADLQVFDWLSRFMERLTFVRPGQFEALRTELKAMLLEELDFVLEARYQRLFRRYLKEDRIDWVSAPRVVSELCGEDVLTSEFVEGISCLEVLAAFETQNEVALARLAGMGINVDEVAERVIRLSYWGKYEAPFFHGDPHPGNVVVQEGSLLVMLDFGACVSVSARNRGNLWMVQERLVQDDATTASEYTVAEMAPLPHVDVADIRRGAHDVLATLLLAVRDEEAEWWEKSTAGMWLAFLQTAREKNLTVNLDTLRQVRMSLLYDTLALRLAPHGGFEGFERYLKGMDERGLRRVARRRPQLVVPLQRAGRAIAGMGGQLEALTQLDAHLHMAVSRGAFLVRTLITHSAMACSVLAVAFWVALFQAAGQEGPAPAVRGALTHPLTVAALVLVALHAARSLLHRLEERR